VEDIKVRTCFVTKFSRAQEFRAARSESTSQLAPPLGFDYPLDGSKILHVDGKLRERACELLFERDSEETSVAMLILNSLVKCPVDTRRALADNIIITGGTAMLPGFRHRLMSELDDLITLSVYKDNIGVRRFKFHTPPAKENYVAWLGGAIYGALEVLESRSFSRELYEQGQPLPDWCVLRRDQDECNEKSGAALRRK